MYTGDAYPHEQPTNAHNSKVKVEDALSYLDQVKTQFGNEPLVYTQFLDIMKDFKSQTIDTPGVIMRVSALFAGRPHLITGFNQFLPTGFEVTIEGESIIISEPNGQKKIITGGGLVTVLPGPSFTSFMDVMAKEIEHQPHDNQKEGETVQGAAGKTKGSEKAAPKDVENEEDEYEDLEEEARMIAPLERPEEIEQKSALDQSLSFVNKIKTRFNDGGHVYRQFLIILQNYHGEVEADKAIFDAVSVLFANEQDLLEEFRLFMPSVYGTRQRIPLAEVPVDEKDSDEDTSDFENEFIKRIEAKRVAKKSSAKGKKAAKKTDKEAKKKVADASSILHGKKLEAGDALVQTKEGLFHVGPVKEKTICDEKKDKPSSKKKLTQNSNIKKIIAKPKTQGKASKKSLEKAIDKAMKEDKGHYRTRAKVKAGKLFKVTLDDEEEEYFENEKARILKELNTLPIGSDDDADINLEDLEISDVESNSSEDSSSESELDIPSEAAKPYFPLDKKEATEVLERINATCFELIEVVQRTCSDCEFDCFMRSLNLYTSNVITAPELIKLVKPIIGGSPKLINTLTHLVIKDKNYIVPKMVTLVEAKQVNIDFSTCRQYGISYRSLPPGISPARCSGRTQLCESVLNDYWISYPCWLSEDSSVVSAKKTPYEDFVCRTEEERYELDIIIENNKYAIDALDALRRKLIRMSIVEQEKLKLDEKLGATSGILMTKAIRRIYGEHSGKIIDALKRNPYLTVPKILDRMKDKEREWRTAQENMNKIWREQNDRHMAKALDHQGVTIRTADAKWMKPKQIIHQMEVLFDERQTKCVEGLSEDEGPHVIMTYPVEKEVLYDINDLLMHFVNRQNYPQHEKDKVKLILDKYLTEWFFLHPLREQLEKELEEQKEELQIEEQKKEPAKSSAKKKLLQEERVKFMKKQALEDVKFYPSGREILLYGGNALLVFIRLHHVMCERLSMIKRSFKQSIKSYEDDMAVHEKRRQLYAECGPKGYLTHELNIFDMMHGLPELRNFGTMRTPYNAYSDFLMECKGYIEGAIDSASFEDATRILFPLEAYLFFTIDKMIATAARQLHPVAIGTDAADCIQMYDKYKITPPFHMNDKSDFKAGATMSYSDEAEEKLNCQNCFRLLFLDEIPLKLAIELVDTETGEDYVAQTSSIVKQACKKVEVYSDGEDEARKSKSGGKGKGKESDNGKADEPMEVDNTGAVSSSAAPAIVDDILLSNGYKKNPVFLKRTLAPKKHLALQGLVFIDGVYKISAKSTKLVSSSTEGFIRKKIYKTPKARGQEKNYKVRKQRMNALFRLRKDGQQEISWLDKDSIRKTNLHKQFPYIRYTQYYFRTNPIFSK